MRASILILFLLLLGLSACAESDSEYQARWARWHGQRIEALKRPEGWLTLAGLWWLEDGEYPMGSAASNRIRFPKGPAHVGTLRVQGNAVEVEVLPGNGFPPGVGPMVEDAPYTWGTLKWFLIRRLGRVALRLKDSANPALLTFQDIPTYPVETRWRLRARFERYPVPLKFELPLGNGFKSMEECPGAVLFEIGGKSYRLDALTEHGRPQLCVIFGDKTNGQTTYGGGRMVYVEPPGPDGSVELDFNQTMVPPCCLTPHTSCNLPPAQNVLDIPIEAGEKLR